MTITVRLPADEERRLNALAQRTGRSKSFYVREALTTHMEDLEDAYAAHTAYNRHVASGREARPLSELTAELLGEESP
jgi:RHH-type transcriptional regulator, rel operon repressor / antitoxin RelB